MPEMFNGLWVQAYSDRRGKVACVEITRLMAGATKEWHLRLDCRGHAGWAPVPVAHVDRGLMEQAIAEAPWPLTCPLTEWEGRMATGVWRCGCGELRLLPTRRCGRCGEHQTPENGVPRAVVSMLLNGVPVKVPGPESGNLCAGCVFLREEKCQIEEYGTSCEGTIYHRRAV